MPSTPTVHVEGLVLHSAEEAAAGASVRARSGDVERTANSDENGYFDLGELPAGKVVVAASWEDLEVEDSLDLDPARAFLSVHPHGWIEERPGRLDGQFTDRDGGSVEGVTIRIVDSDRSTQLEVVTDANGRFEVLRLPAGHQRLSAERDGETLVDVDFPVGWLADERIDVDASGTIERDLGFFRGQLFDADNEGEEGVTVRLTEVLLGTTYSATTGEFGGFVLGVDAPDAETSDEQTGVPVGMYHVEVRRSGELLIERRLMLHPYMYLEISAQDGMHEGGSAAAALSAGEDDFHTVMVFYGTDRKREGSNDPAEIYGGKRGELELGKCEVSIPFDHRLGELEAPSFWRLQFREDPEKHVVLLSVEPQPRDEFVAELRARVEDSRERRAFVFVHGYNVTFENAARRTGQMAYDLQFDGAPILYSWPSKGSLQGYMADEASAGYTAPHLEEFLRLVARESGAEVVHLIAHSMGNRAMTVALSEISREPQGPRFDQIALVAPDIDADVFKRDIAPRIVTTGERVTLYASATDQALEASKKVHAAPRAGDASDGALVVPGIDTIDVTGLDTSFLGHSYFAENRSVIADLIYLLHQGTPPEERDWLLPVVGGGPDGERYWRFRHDEP